MNTKYHSSGAVALLLPLHFQLLNANFECFQAKHELNAPCRFKPSSMLSCAEW